MLTGTWRGTYRYDVDDYPDLPPPVTFVLSVTEDARGRVKGEVKDDAREGGFPEAGVVKGKRRGSDLIFYKVMPTKYMAYEDGLVELSEWLKIEHGKPLVPEDLPEHCIQYSGTIDETGERIQGIWNILETESDLPLEEQGLMGGGGGTFSMEKLSEETSDVSLAFGDDGQKLKKPSVPVQSSRELFGNPDNFHIEITESRQVGPCPCCRGTRRVRAGHFALRQRRYGSFLVHTTEGSTPHDIEVDLIIPRPGCGDEDRATVSLVERDIDGQAVVELVDGRERPAAEAGCPVRLEDILGTESELYAKVVWQAIRRAL